jgi:hypothetical protein
LNAIIGHGLMVVGAILASLFAMALFELGGQQLERGDNRRMVVVFRLFGAVAIFLAVMFGRFV